MVDLGSEGASVDGFRLIHKVFEVRHYPQLSLVYFQLFVFVFYLSGCGFLQGHYWLKKVVLLIKVVVDFFSQNFSPLTVRHSRKTKFPRH